MLHARRASSCFCGEVELSEVCLFVHAAHIYEGLGRESRAPSAWSESEAARRTGVNLLQVACASTRRRFPPGLARTIANKLLAQLPLGRLRPRTGDAALQVATPRAAISTGPSRRLSPSSCDVVQRKQSNVVNGGKPDFGSTIRCCIGLQLRHERPQVHSPS
jgi:hypothetical protein